jgi:hypothetical protein
MLRNYYGVCYLSGPTLNANSTETKIFHYFLAIYLCLLFNLYKKGIIIPSVIYSEDVFAAVSVLIKFSTIFLLL